ncbi:MAG: acyl-CoA dehydrogenase family protein [Acidimicrobiia bacterium]
MKIEWDRADLEFRDEVRTWLRENAPSEPRPLNGHSMREFDLAWQRTQWDGGWAGISWPAQFGGRGLSLVQQLIWFEEYGQLDLPVIDSTFVGLRHAGPTLIARATDEQKAAHLAPILRGDVVWCQGFSEPEAGSDLASLRTRGVVDGDELVVTGQKVWTSFADIGDWQELLVRTDLDGSKHKGLTWIICDMHSPGIEVRPIKTMDGGSDFSEVFYDEVRIPIGNIVGRLHDGWSVAMSTLAFERGTAFTVNQVKLSAIVERLIDDAKRLPAPGGGGRAIDDDEFARDLARVRADAAALRSMTYMGISRNLRSPMPGPEGSMLKIAFGDLEQRVFRLLADLHGDELLRHPGNTWVRDYLYSYAATIGGGTSEIQRNIVAEKVLGLPR